MGVTKLDTRILDYGSYAGSMDVSVKIFDQFP